MFCTMCNNEITGLAHVCSLDGPAGAVEPSRPQGTVRLDKLDSLCNTWLKRVEDTPDRESDPAAYAIVQCRNELIILLRDAAPATPGAAAERAARATFKVMNLIGVWWDEKQRDMVAAIIREEMSK